jgi:hypothetical protein
MFTSDLATCRTDNGQPMALQISLLVEMGSSGAAELEAAGRDLAHKWPDRKQDGAEAS